MLKGEAMHCLAILFPYRSFPLMTRNESVRESGLKKLSLLFEISGHFFSSLSRNFPSTTSLVIDAAMS